MKCFISHTAHFCNEGITKTEDLVHDELELAEEEEEEERLVIIEKDASVILLFKSFFFGRTPIVFFVLEFFFNPHYILEFNTNHN